MAPADETLIDALDLAERILDELSRPRQHWRAVEHLATALARLARREVCRVSGRRPDQPG